MQLQDLYAAIVESTEAAIISKDLEGRVLTWNMAAEKIFGWTAAEMVGQPLSRIIPTDREAEEAYILAAVRQGEAATRMETVRLRKDGSLVDIAVLVSPIRDADGVIIGASKIARELTDELRVRAALNESETRFSLMADNISQLAWIADGEGWIFWYNRRWFDYTGTALEDMAGWGWKSVQHPDHIDRVVERISYCFANGIEWEDTFPLRAADGEYRWFLSRAVPMRDNQSKVLYWFGTNTDITEQRDAERRIQLLLMEVNHRSKNLLAVVQSIARRTAAKPEDFIPRLERRIAALSANQDVLVNRDWAAVPLHELIEGQLLFLGQLRTQITLSGPTVVIQPATAEALGMTLHELASNAENYGALFVPEGRVAIEWHVLGSGADAQFVLNWTETNGPRITGDPERGFGTRIIEEVPRGRLRGTVALAYPPEGFHFTLQCPVANVLAKDD